MLSMQDREIVLDDIGNDSKIILIPYSVYVVLIQSLGDRAMYCQVSSSKVKNCTLTALVLGDYYMVPDHRID